MEGQYLLAWGIYVLSGMVFTGVLVALSRRFRDWFRDLLVGTAVILIFTPWYFGENADHWAPALLVLLMDVLLEGTESGLQGGVVLLCMATVMVGVLLIRIWLRARKSGQNDPVTADPG